MKSPILFSSVLAVTSLGLATLNAADSPATPAATGQAEAPATFPVGALQFQRPTEWKWVPVQSPMRKAHLQVTGADATKIADITFFHFGQDMGGSIKDNADRWVKQFQSAPGAEKVEATEINGRKVTLVTTEGTFAGGMPGAGGGAAPLTDYALLGAIIEDAGGNVFVKMTGPKAVVSASREKFMAFLGTAKK